MSSRIHHLSCATMCPFGGSLFGGEGKPWTTAELCAHVLLIEAADSLVIVDTGFGLDQATEAKKRLPALFRANVRPRMNAAQTAIRQVEALGFSASDVRHVVPTHLDIDHAGGLPDFPDAEIHVWRPEMEAVQRPGLREKPRYMKHLFAHGPKFQPHDVDGDEWMGFEAVRALPGLEPEILIVPLPGHSRGHSAVAVKDGDGWLLHCGDGYFHRHQVRTPAGCPPGLRAFQAVVGLERKRRLENEERLRELNARKGGPNGEIRMFCAHDLAELESLRSGAADK
jgi:glyoxylase-like metal-dependent hydrolase (beta-lactamase superfamily II)